MGSNEERKMKHMNLIINKEILEVIAKADLSISQYLILILYRQQEVFDSEILDTLVSERKGLTEATEFSALCRKGYLEKLNTKIFKLTSNYILTDKGQNQQPI